MLVAPGIIARQQLLEDLLAVRQRLEAGWVQTWQSGGSVCLVAACESVLDLPIGMYRVKKGSEDEKDQRLGRMIVTIYLALYGPKAPLDIPLSTAMSKLIHFNDCGTTSKEGVLHLLDKAIQECLEPALVAQQG